MAEIDRREAILARLKIVAKVDGIKEVFRDIISIPETKRPAVVILDADEAADETEVPVGRGRPGPVSPLIVNMTPEIYILLGNKAEDIGSTLNAFRIKLIKAILTDETLIGLTKDGDIKYLGFATGLASGRSIEGEAGISFRFPFLVRPAQL